MIWTQLNKPLNYFLSDHCKLFLIHEQSQGVVENIILNIQNLLQ